MKKALLATATIFMLATNISCWDDKDDDIPEPVKPIDPTLISQTDFAGNPMSIPDITDWTLDNGWNTKEYDLFPLAPSPAELTNIQTANITINPGYPNPCGLQFMLNIKTSTPAFLRVVTTDEMLNVIDRRTITTNAGNNNFAFAFDPSKYKNNQYYRLYYLFYNGQGEKYYKGHGDFKISR